MPKNPKKYSTPDADNPEWTKEKFARAMRFNELPEDLQRILSKGTRGPQKKPTKKLISIRLSQDVVEALRASGRGWQSRADEALRSWITRQQKLNS